MNTLDEKKEKQKFSQILRKEVLLGLAFVLIIATGMRWNVAIAGWLYPIPLLMYVRMGYPWKSLIGVMFLAFLLEVLKIASEPMYAMIALGAAIQITLSMSLILYLVNKFQNKMGKDKDIIVPLIFASLVTLAEYMGAQFSVLGVWGMAANTQLDNLPMLQVASVTGAYGISFIMMWFSAVAESLIFKIANNHAIDRAYKKSIMALCLTLIMVYIFGAYRLDMANQGPSIHVTGVSAKKYGVGDVMKSEAARLANNDEVFELLEKGAVNTEILVSNEGALFIKPEEEKVTMETLRLLAKKHEIYLAVGYIIYRGQGKKFLNQMAIVNSHGEILQKYDKQFIPPGEPSEWRKSEIQSFELLPNFVHDNKGLKISGAICYDFDSMALTKSHGKSGSGLVLLPSSDWRGIDPIHTQMARLRAIEQGFSVARSVRASISEFYDPFGRIRGSLAWFENNDGILTAQLPVIPVSTPYKAAGDWFVYLNMFFLSAMGLIYFSQKKDLNRAV